MFRTVLNAKLHRVKVTEANLDYMGSITIDQDILDYSGIKTHEKVQVVNLNNGERFETYVIAGKPGSKTICLNGAAARKAQKNDEIIVMSYAVLEEKEMDQWEPKVVFFDDENNMIKD